MPCGLWETDGQAMLFFKSRAGGPAEFLVVGLGNPGKKYENTRHNAGFLAVTALAEKLGATVDRLKFHALTAQASVEDTRVLLMMPQTYMNLSGQAVAEALRFYKLPPERVLVMSDDIALPVGALRLRRRGSDGGQKGLRSIIEQTGSEDFPRIRLGVGEKPRPDYDLADWVLSRFTAQEAPRMKEAAEKAAEAACLIVRGNMDAAMNRYSR